MPSKFTNLTIRETRFSLRLVIIIVIILSSVWLWKKEKIQITQLKKVSAEKQLVVKIPELEKQIQSYGDPGRIKSRESKKITRNDLVLKGIFFQNNMYFVLIGDTFYKKGDTCGNFDILNIDLNYVTIQDINTKQTEVLRFSD